MYYIIKERVTFEYTWRVEADSKADAKHKIDDLSDGEAESHEEIRRSVHSVIEED
jgi:hypothetical protein